MRKVALVEDEKEELERLLDYFGNLGEMVGEQIICETFPNGEAFLAAYDHSYDIVTLDIELGDGHKDGMAIAASLREQDSSVIILFITNLSQYAIRGYEVRAIDFLVKPISFPAFVLKLRAVFSILQSRDKRNIYLPTEGGFRIVSSADILFFEVQGHYVTVHCKDRPDLVYKDSLRSLEEKLAGLPFQRCNHCYLVNLSHVAGIDHGDVLVGSARLPVSRPKKKAFLEALTKYMGGI